VSFASADVKWRKHAVEFPEFRTTDEYAENAARLVGQSEPTDDILIGRRERDGATIVYERSTNTIVISDQNAETRTSFRPMLGEAYFREQIG